MSYRGDVNRNTWTTRFKYFLYSYHVISFLLGVVVLTMAIYIRAEWTIKHYIYELGAYIMWTGPYILMASSSITILLSFLGCWGTIHENPFLLSVFTIVTGAAALIGLGGVAYSLNHGTLFSAITPWLTDRFTYLTFESAHDTRAARIVRIIQKDLGCCGGGGWQDYSTHNMDIPPECRSTVTGNMHTFGCGIIFSEYLEPLIGWMSGVALLLIVLQLIAMAVAMIFRRKILDEEETVFSGKNKSTYIPVQTRRI